MIRPLHIDDTLFHAGIVELLRIASTSTDEKVKQAFAKWESSGCPLVNVDGLKGAISEDDIEQLKNNLLCKKSIKQKVANAYTVLSAVHEREKERNTQRQKVVTRARQRIIAQHSEVVSLAKGDFLRLLTEFME